MDTGDSILFERENREQSLPRIGDERAEAEWLAAMA